MTGLPTTYNQRGDHPTRPELEEYADEWGRAARSEVDTVKRAIATAAHAECLRRLRRARLGQR